MPNIALAIGGLDRPLGSSGCGIRMALIRYCAPRLLNRCKRCGHGARNFCTWFHYNRPRTELTPYESRSRNWDSAIRTIRLSAHGAGSRQVKQTQAVFMSHSHQPRNITTRPPDPPLSDHEGRGLATTWSTRMAPGDEHSTSYSQSREMSFNAHKRHRHHAPSRGCEVKGRSF